MCEVSKNELNCPSFRPVDLGQCHDVSGTFLLGRCGMQGGGSVCKGNHITGATKPKRCRVSAVD